MGKLGQSGVGFKGIYNVLSSRTNLNKLTTYTVLMSTGNNAFETHLQSCPGYCQSFTLLAKKLEAKHYHKKHCFLKRELEEKLVLKRKTKLPVFIDFLTPLFFQRSRKYFSFSFLLKHEISDSVGAGNLWTSPAISITR